MLRELLRDFLGIQSPPAAVTPSTPSEYDLKIDLQVEKFVENKQKLAYFLITASITVIGFIVNFAVTHPPRLPSMVIFSSIAGLFTSGFSLLNLRVEHRSYNLHLKNRYLKKTWNDLTPKEQTQWDRLNQQASFFIGSAFMFLFIEILFEVVSLVMIFLEA
jgi:hypothetical protein